MRLAGTVARGLTSGALISADPRDPAMLVGRLGRIYRLNLSAAAIWDALQDPVSAEEIAARLSSMFEVGCKEALDQVLPFLDAMLERGLVAKVASP